MFYFIWPHKQPHGLRNGKYWRPHSTCWFHSLGLRVFKLKWEFSLELISKVFSHSNRLHDGSIFHMEDLSIRYIKASCPKPHCKSRRVIITGQYLILSLRLPYQWSIWAFRKGGLLLLNAQSPCLLIPFSTLIYLTTFPTYTPHWLAAPLTFALGSISCLTTAVFLA